MDETYRATSVEDLDSIELGLLGDAVGLGADGASAVSAMAVSISVGAVSGVVGQEGGAALELGVSGGDTGVDHVHTRASTSGGVVSVRKSRLAGLVGDTRETPGRGALGSVGLLLERLRLAQVGPDNSILLDVIDLFELETACITMLGKRTPGRLRMRSTMSSAMSAAKPPKLPKP